ncbi:MAG: hypothetical protein R3C43_19330 [Chloroflexota bacterium]
MTPRATRNRPSGSPSTQQPTPAVSPAARLVIAILHQAAHDYAAGSPAAAEFIRGRYFNFYCDLIGVHPDYLRRQLQTHFPSALEATHQ